MRIGFTSGKWFGKAFKIHINYKRNWKLFVMILKFKCCVSWWNFYSFCFVVGAIYDVFFKKILFGEMRKTFLTSVCYFIGSWSNLRSKQSIECFHSRGQHLCKFIGTKGDVCIRKELNSHRICLGHQHGRRFIVLGHQYGRRDVMWKHSIRTTDKTIVRFSILFKKK